MALKISIHGDWLERKAASFIMNKIPAYEKIWTIYIGHKGEGEISDINTTDDDLLGKRQIFSQHHYTILESIYFMNLISKSLSDKNFETDPFERYIHSMIKIQAFFSYVGRLKDNLAKCYSLFFSRVEFNEKISKLEEFWHARNIVLHGKKIPISINDSGMILMPKIKKSKNDQDGFGFDTMWDEVTIDDLSDCGIEIQRLFIDFTKIVSTLLDDLFVKVKFYVDHSDLKLILNEKFIENPLTYSNPPSSSFANNIQGPQGLNF